MLISFFKNWQPSGFPRVTHSRRCPGPCAPLPPTAARSARSIPEPRRGCPAVPAQCCTAGKESRAPKTALPGHPSPGTARKGLSLLRHHPAVSSHFGGGSAPRSARLPRVTRAKPVCASRLEYSLLKVFSGRDRSAGLGRTVRGSLPPVPPSSEAACLLVLGRELWKRAVVFTRLFVCGVFVSPVATWGRCLCWAAPQAAASPGRVRGRPPGLGSSRTGERGHLSCQGVKTALGMTSKKNKMKKYTSVHIPPPIHRQTKEAHQECSVWPAFGQPGRPGAVGKRPSSEGHRDSVLFSDEPLPGPHVRGEAQGCVYIPNDAAR